MPADPQPAAPAIAAPARAVTALLPPCVILCGPQMGENIGACARAMKNCGLDDLRLVDPRDGWPNPAANAMAAHALLQQPEGVLLVGALDEALVLLLEGDEFLLEVGVLLLGGAELLLEALVFIDEPAVGAL